MAARTQKLTQTNVKRLGLAPADAPFIVKDEELPGFHLRVSHRAKVYKLKIDVRANGQRATKGFTLGDAESVTADEARRRAEDIIRKRDDGELSVGRATPPVADPAAITLGQVWQAYRLALLNEQKSERTLQFYDDVFRLFLGPRVPGGTAVSWADSPMRNITRTDVIAFHREVTDRGNPYRANQICRMGNAVWNFGLKGLRVLDLPALSPFQSYRLANKEKARVHGIGLAKLPVWFDKVEKLSPVFRELNLFYLLTSLRRETVETLRWTQVNLNGRYIEIPKPKGGEDRAFRMPLSRAMIRCLWRARRAGRMLHEVNSKTWVFPSATSRSGHIEESKSVSRWKRKDGSVVIHKRVDKSPHALRSSWKTIASGLGINADHRHVIMNHKLPKTVHDNYTNVGEMFDDLVATQEKMSRAIIGAIAEGRKGLM
jgi:hypothetical protein